MHNFKAYIKANFEKIDSLSNKQNCSRVFIKQLDLSRMILAIGPKTLKIKWVLTNLNLSEEIFDNIGSP